MKRKLIGLFVLVLLAVACGLIYLERRINNIQNGENIDDSLSLRARQIDILGVRWQRKTPYVVEYDLNAILEKLSIEHGAEAVRVFNNLYKVCIEIGPAPRDSNVTVFIGFYQQDRWKWKGSFVLCGWFQSADFGNIFRIKHFGGNWAHVWRW